jgi:hypothetical protein
MTLPPRLDNLELVLEKYMESKNLRDMLDFKKEFLYEKLFTDEKTLQHFYNPVHVYCRMIKNGYDKDTASTFCRMYETNLRGVIYGKN